MQAAGIQKNNLNEAKKPGSVRHEKMKNLLEALDKEDEMLPPEDDQEGEFDMPNLSGEAPAPEGDEMGMEPGMGDEMAPEGDMDMGGDVGIDDLGGDMGMGDEESLTSGDLDSLIDISSEDALKLTKAIADTVSAFIGKKIEVEAENGMGEEDGEEGEIEMEPEMGGEEMAPEGDEMGMEPEMGGEEEGEMDMELPSLEGEEEEDEKFKALKEAVSARLATKLAALKNKKKI
jgi:hypothetical protein